MKITIFPQKLNGSLRAIPSKSQAHRLLICAAFADKPMQLNCPQTNEDIEATAACLRSLGAEIIRNKDGYSITPIQTVPESATLPCGESGSTLRFLLPVVGALGVDATFITKGRLAQRPLCPLWEEMERMGCNLSRPESTTIRCTGRLRTGTYEIAGNVSSQFISGLLFAAALLPGSSKICITGTVESQPYIQMTKDALSIFGVNISGNTVQGDRQFRTPKESLDVEGDWSNAAFFLAANAMGSNISIENINRNSAQGDRAVEHQISRLHSFCTVDGANIPDLVPILAVFSATRQGALFTNIHRLRLKETDRVATICGMLNSLGIQTSTDENSLLVKPGLFTGGIVDATGDHRIAMAAAIAATCATAQVTILGAESVNKSYPSFWTEYRRLGGSYELDLW